MSADRPSAAVAGFWRRVFAFLIDGALFAIPAYGVALLFIDALIALGGWGRLVGYAIGLVYFGLMDSGVGRGQSVGKRVAKIKVVTASGGFLTFPRAGLRYTILQLPFLLNGIDLPGPAITSRFAQVLISTAESIAVIGLGLSLIYLLIFNRRTRQSLHDLAVGAYVVRAAAPGPDPAPVWIGHYVAVALFFAASALAPAALQYFFRDQPSPDLSKVHDSLEALPDVQSAAVWASPGGRVDRIAARVFVKKKHTDFDAVATQVAQTILREWPAATDMDSIRVNVGYHFDIGIASGSWNQWFSHSPSEWKQKIEAQPAAAMPQ